MAVDARPRRHASRTMLVVGVLGLILMGAQCSPALRPPPVPPGPIKDAAAEFQAAIKLLSTRVGLSAKKVEDDIRRANPGLTEEGLVDVAKNAADIWQVMDKLATQAEQETRSVIARSTCYWLTAPGDSEDERNAALQTFIKSQPAVARLDEPKAKVDEIINGIKTQMDMMRARGLTDRDAMTADAACWLLLP